MSAAKSQINGLHLFCKFLFQMLTIKKSVSILKKEL